MHRRADGEIAEDGDAITMIKQRRQLRGARAILLAGKKGVVVGGLVDSLDDLCQRSVVKLWENVFSV